MNLYLVLALALGAVSAAPSPQPQTASVVAQRSERAVVVEHRLQPVPAARLKPGLHSPLPATRLILSGSAMPRAPALS